MDLPTTLQSFITTPRNWSVPFDDALEQDTWQDAIVADPANRIYKWPNVNDVPEYAGSETVYLRNVAGVAPVVDGKYEWLFLFSKTTCFHKAAFSHRASEGRIILIDQAGNLYGTKVMVGGVPHFAGFTIEMLHTENLRFNDGTRPSETPVRVGLANPNEINHYDYGLIRVAPSWSISSLDVLMDVDITVVSATDALIVVDVAQSCDGEPLLGLVTADFVVLDETGAAQTVAVTPSTTVPGRYNLAGTDLESGTVSLSAPADLSIQAYESNVVSVTIA